MKKELIIELENYRSELKDEIENVLCCKNVLIKEEKTVRKGEYGRNPSLEKIVFVPDPNRMSWELPVVVTITFNNDEFQVWMHLFFDGRWHQKSINDYEMEVI